MTSLRYGTKGPKGDTGPTGPPGSAGGSGTVKAHTFQAKIDGNFNVSSATFAVVDAALDCTVVAAIGDLIQVAVSGGWFANAGGGEGHLQVVTVDPTASNATINGFGNGTDGVAAWASYTDTSYVAVAGSIFYRVLAGDIKNGNVKVRLQAKRTGGSNRPLAANGAVPLTVYLVNHGIPAN